ncbi:MAG TPA: DUF4270 domain-containing protein [Candidatus Coprenecus merdipullorum]|nr:DUF4270 domain-containing protein [Candidatus Coprenecus merdipullorum]
MSFRTAFYAVLTLIAAAAASSCVENDREMGKGILPEGFIPELGVKTFDVPVTNRVSDSVQASNSSNMLIGTLSDPVFGTVTCNAASFIVPYSDSTDFGDSPELLGAYITLSIDSTYFLDNSQEGIHQRVRIYKLTHALDTVMMFCNSITPEYYDPVPVTVSDPVIYGTGEIRVDLTDEFASELLATTPEEFEDFDLFFNRIYGLYIEVEQPLTTSASGGRLNYLNLGYSSINLEYRRDIERNGGIETIDTTESFVFGYYTAINNFSTTSSHLESNNPGDSLYLEGLTGIKPHISALSLKSMIDGWITSEELADYAVLISRAELSFPYMAPEDYERFDKEHPAIIYAFTSVPWATDTLRFYNPLEEVYNISNIGSINRSEMAYNMDITSYIQQLMNTDVSAIDSSLDLWIAPMSARTSSYTGSTYYSFNNHDYNKIILHGPTSDRKPVLTITYALTER